MRKTHLIFTLLVGFLLSWGAFNLMPAHAVNGGSSRILKSLNQCLPKSEVSKYGYSLAASTKDRGSQWYLVRSHSNPLLAPTYSVLQVSGKKCINFNKLPTLDISRTPKVPRMVLHKFSSFIVRDRQIAWSLYQKRIQQQYPGKSMKELQQMGVFGMDSL
jgi:hypothetical protein